MGRKPTDLTGQTFGTWEAKELLSRRRSGGSAMWRFQCSGCNRSMEMSGSQMVCDDAHGRRHECACQIRERERVRYEAIFAAISTGRTHADVAAEYGITKQRVEQIVELFIDRIDVAGLIEGATREELVAALAIVNVKWRFKIAINIMQQRKGKS